MISVRKLTKVYGHTLAVDNISFDVEKGKIIGFLGPNGAGKSTTLKMLTCFLPPTSGGASVAGYDIFHQSEKVRENLGYLPENVPLYPEMKVREYLEYRGRLRSMRRSQRRKQIEHVLERCWLTGVSRKSIGHLSKGYRQRVGLADTLLHDPAVLILDEPTVGLDPTQIRETRKLVRELGGDHTVILSTHILPEVEATCDSVVVIAAGRIVAEGTPEQLRDSRRLTARVLVECKGPQAQIVPTLQAMPDIQSLEILQLPKEDNSYMTIALRPAGAVDIRESVARTIVQKGWALREIRLEHATLEEFFVQVTAEQAAAREAASN